MQCDALLLYEQHIYEYLYRYDFCEAALQVVNPVLTPIGKRYIGTEPGQDELCTGVTVKKQRIEGSSNLSGRERMKPKVLQVN